MNVLEVNAQLSDDYYDRACSSRGLNEEDCNWWKQRQREYLIDKSNSAGQQKKVYKMRLRDAAIGNANQNSIFSPGDRDREEWIVVTVINNQTFKVRHATNIENKFWGFRKWFDHPAIAIRVCAFDQFDLNDCQTAQGDTALIPEGKTIHDIQIDFKYSEGGAIYTRSVQVSPDAKAE
ncbi:hypothetical protein [Myxosarcina sp. GI1]|uniref:hypothetical protein n=1 Tax=Myxosarcina sp. GI1 TaxID=1541065 RepID=UPI00056CC3A0|nr:hypothetical protein [Myxosarcina sp. GI1]